MIKEHDRVVLNTALPSEGLEPGDVGTVVHVYGDGKAYEVEFVTLDGHTATVATVEAAQVGRLAGATSLTSESCRWPDPLAPPRSTCASEHRPRGSLKG
jgi:hypothetical protein